MTRRRWVSPRAHRLLWDGHSVIGVVCGLALFVIFYCGSFSLFRSEIMLWADPVLGRPHQTPPRADPVILPILEKHPPEGGTNMMIVYPFSGRPFYWLRYDARDGEQIDTWVSADDGAMVPPRGRSRLSEIIYKLHYFEQLGLAGRILSGIVAVFMGTALISGLLIHIRKLPSHLHTFRVNGSLQTAISDGHAVLGVLGLPFTLMYAITGAFFSLLIVLLGPTVALVFEGKQDALDAVIAGIQAPEWQATERAAEMQSPDALTRALSERWGAFEPFRLDYVGFGREGARVTIQGAQPETLATSGNAVLGGSSGEVLRDVPPSEATTLGRTVAVMTNLHFASFGGLLVDLLFFVLGLLASGVILSGNLLWLLARRSRDARSTPWLHRVLARLTVGVGVGLTAAVPLAFVASRLVPLELPGRGAFETSFFFGSWLVLVGLSFVGRSPWGAARWQLALAGAASLAVPVASAAVLGRLPWSGPVEGNWGPFVVEAGFFLCGAAMLPLASALGSVRSD